MAARAKVMTAILLVACGVQGCGFTQRLIDKPWGKRTFIPALVCGGIGAGTGWIIQNNRPGTSIILDTNGTVIAVAEDNKEQWKGAAVGGAIGLVLCGLVGHALEPTPTPIPPPPPPPPPTPTPEVVRRRIILRGVNFDFDKSDIRPDSRPVLDEAAFILRENPDIRVSVEGHTDGMGTDVYNMALGERRAAAVYRYLVAAGIDPGRMETKSFGESQPVADNSTETGRAQNRRTELRVLGQ